MFVGAVAALFVTAAATVVHELCALYAAFGGVLPNVGPGGPLPPLPLPMMGSGPAGSLPPPPLFFMPRPGEGGSSCLLFVVLRWLCSDSTTPLLLPLLLLLLRVDHLRLFKMPVCWLSLQACLFLPCRYRLRWRGPRGRFQGASWGPQGTPGALRLRL